MKGRFIGDKPTREVREFGVWLEKHIGVNHRVMLDLCATPVQGYFDPKPDAPLIIAQTGNGILDTLAHEYVHYEQWRDDRPITERGVSQRAAALVRKWRRERP